MGYLYSLHQDTQEQGQGEHSTNILARRYWVSDIDMAQSRGEKSAAFESLKHITKNEYR